MRKTYSYNYLHWDCPPRLSNSPWIHQKQLSISCLAYNVWQADDARADVIIQLLPALLACGEGRHSRCGAMPYYVTRRGALAAAWTVISLVHATVPRFEAICMRIVVDSMV